MVLTPAGERVLASARRVLDDLARAEDDLRSLSAPGTGVLRLCTQCNTGYHWLPPLLETFHRSYPAVEVQIVVAATDRPVEALLEGQIDLAFITDGTADTASRDPAGVQGRAGRRGVALASVRAPGVHRARRAGRHAPAALQPRPAQQRHLPLRPHAGRRGAGPRVAGPAHRSHPRADQGRPGHRGDGALGDRAGHPVGGRAGRAHRPPRGVPRLAGGHAPQPSRAEVAEGLRRLDGRPGAPRAAVRDRGLGPVSRRETPSSVAPSAPVAPARRRRRRPPPPAA